VSQWGNEQTSRDEALEYLAEIKSQIAQSERTDAPMSPTLLRNMSRARELRRAYELTDAL
jgi:hypothetical protein